MPLPTPNSGESQSDFMARCMPVTSRDPSFSGNRDQQVAVCMSQFRKASKGVKLIDADAGIIGGWGIPFGGPLKGGLDLEGERFTKDTNFCFDWFPNEGRPVLWEHGTDEKLKLDVIGRQFDKFVDPDAGVWVDIQLNMAHRYAKLIIDLAKKGVLGFSSGALSGYVRRMGQDIKQWPWIEQTLTPRPANPAALIEPVVAMKHLQFLGYDLEELGIKALGDGHADAEAVIKAIAHGAYDGEHSHAHAAYGQQGDDMTHDHAHAHKGDAVHQHQHADEHKDVDDLLWVVDANGAMSTITLDGKIVWTAAYINDLPDSAFAVIDDNGRHLPHHDDGGGVDEPHLRNALQREPQTKLSPANHAKARAHLERHASALGIGGGKTMELPQGMDFAAFRTALETAIGDAWLVDVTEGKAVVRIGEQVLCYPYTVEDGAVKVTGEGEPIVGWDPVADHKSWLDDQVKKLTDLQRQLYGEQPGSSSKTPTDNSIPSLETEEQKARRLEVDRWLASVQLRR